MKKITKAVIPVAGLGTRFLPITKGVAKELLPIIDKPALQYIIEECVASGIEEIYLITSPLKPAIKNYFSKNIKLEKFLSSKEKYEELKLVQNISNICKIYYLVQKEPLGSGHAVNLAQKYIKNKPFAVLYGDDLMSYDKPVLKQLIEVYEKNDSNVLGVKKVKDDLVNRYGIIEFEDENLMKVKSIVEKPNIDSAPSNIASLGRYILKPEIFNELDNLKMTNKEYQLTNAIDNLMQKQDFYACEFVGDYYDIGSKFGYLKANIEFGLKRDDIKNELQNYLKNIKMD